MYRLFKKCTSLMLILTFICLTFSGCSVEVDPTFSETEIKLSDSFGNNTVSYNQDYISKDIAVVDKDKMDAGDSIMNAGADMIVNVTNNNAIYAKNVFSRLYPASTTKVITALLALENCDMNEIVTIGHEATHITEPGAVLCGFKEGDKIRLRNLLYCMMLYSGNDAATAVAEHVGGSVKGFAAMMNTKAREIGAFNSHFVNPHGLHSKRHYTTAYDLYLFFNQAIKYKLFRKIINTSHYETYYKDKDGGQHHMIVNTTNKYLKGLASSPNNIKVIGGKTGTTQDAGSCLIILSIDKSTKEEFISVVLKAPDSYQLYNQMTALLGKTKGVV